MSQDDCKAVLLRSKLPSVVTDRFLGGSLLSKRGAGGGSGSNFVDKVKVMRRMNQRQTAVSAVLGLLLLPGLAQAQLKHRYSFSEDAGAVTIADSVGGADATLVDVTGGSSFGGGQLTLGNDGGQSSNSGAGDYVDLPNGIVSDLVGDDGSTQFSIEAWFTWTGAGDWQRIWDLGTSVGGEDVSDSGDGTTQIFATPQAGGGGVRVAWRGQGLGETSMTHQPSASANEEHHLVFVWDESDTSASFYLDGALVGRDGGTNITIADNVAGNDVNNWLGRSQWNDTLFVGSYNEFRIWESALGPLDVAKNFIGGADNPDGGDLGSVSSVSATSGTDSLIAGETTTVSVLVDFSQASGLNLTPLATLSSSNENVATVDASGTVAGVGEGSATITAEYEGQSASVTITVASPPLPEAVLKHRYSFGDAAGSSTLEDSVGGVNGEAINVAFSGNGSGDFVAEDLAYVDLPNGIISNLGANGTIEAWTTFDPAGQGGWQRLFDFGNTTLGEDPVAPQAGGDGYNGDASWFFAPRQGGIASNNGGRYAFDPGPGGENPQINPSAEVAPPIGEEFHTVATYNHAQRVAEIWINGSKIGEAPVLADRPLDSLDDVNNWLGRSQWGGDAFSTASFNEFRIYEGVLDPVQIAINAVTGPDEIISDPGAAQGVSLDVDSTSLVAGGLPANAALVVDFENVQGVDLSSSALAEFTSSDSSVVDILTGPVRIIPLGEGSADVTASLDGQSQTVSINVTAAGDAPELLHRYGFDGNANDSVGDANGELIGDGSFDGGAVHLDGSGFVDLPDFFFSSLFDSNEAVTIEIFGHWNGGGAWQRILDIGDNTFGEDWPIPDGTTYNGTSSFYITPSSGGGQLLTTVINAGLDVTLESPTLSGAPLAAGEDFYVTLVLDTANGVSRFYRNGVLADITPIAADQDFTFLDDFNVWLGRSNWSADPNFNGSFSEFRVWSGAMQAAEIELHSFCGPDDLTCEVASEPPVIGIALDGTSVVIDWPSNTVGFTLESAASPAGPWTAVGGNATTAGDRTSVTVEANADAAFFRMAR